jgi:ubiquinone/menaquinone biosynthesis C-methylase UbiE
MASVRKICEQQILKYALYGGLVLDAGCGTFESVNSLKRYINNIVGIDIANNNMAEARKNNFILATIEELPFKDESFDFVFSLSVLQLLKSDIVALNEFRRILKRGGRLLITVPTNRSAFKLLRDLEIKFGVYSYPQFILPIFRYYSRKDIRKIVADNFKIVTITGTDYNFLPRLLKFFINVSKLNGVERKIRKLFSSTKPEFSGSNPRQLKTEKPYHSGTKENSLLHLPEFISDFSYHYLVVLEKP